MVHVKVTIVNAQVILQVNIVESAKQTGMDLIVTRIVTRHSAMVIACIKMVSNVNANQIQSPSTMVDLVFTLLPTRMSSTPLVKCVQMVSILLTRCLQTMRLFLTRNVYMSNVKFNVHLKCVMEAIVQIHWICVRVHRDLILLLDVYIA